MIISGRGIRGSVESQGGPLDENKEKEKKLSPDASGLSFHQAIPRWMNPGRRKGEVPQAPSDVSGDKFGGMWR